MAQETAFIFHRTVTNQFSVGSGSSRSSADLTSSASFSRNDTHTILLVATLTTEYVVPDCKTVNFLDTSFLLSHGFGRIFCLSLEEIAEFIPVNKLSAEEFNRSIDAHPCAALMAHLKV